MGYTTEDSLTLVREYSDEEISNFKDFRPRWVVPQAILDQAYDWSQHLPGRIWVLPAEPELFTKEQEA